MDSPDSASPGPRRRAWSWPFRVTTMLSGLWLLGQIVRDGNRMAALCFYIPSPAVAILLTGWAVWWLVKRRFSSVALAAGLALLPWALVLFVENHRQIEPTPVAGQPLRLVHWNVCCRLDSAALRKQLVAQRADLYVLSEAYYQEALDQFLAGLNDGYSAQLAGPLAVVAAGTIDREVLVNRDRAHVEKYDCEIGERRIVLLAVDLPSTITVARDPLLREINELIERHRPHLVVGDFNAPRRSRGLQQLPEGYRHAYDSVGGGWGYTWPIPLPVYSLDHCLHSDRVGPLRYELLSTLASDHRMQIFDFVPR